MDNFDPRKANQRPNPYTPNTIEHYGSEILEYSKIVGRNARGIIPKNFIFDPPNVRNPHAAEIAGQLYAYSNHLAAHSGGVGHVPINVVAGGTGGVEVREAMEILKLMDGGKQAAKRIRVATLGTPNFALSDIAEERNFQGRGDPLAQPGKQNTRKVRGVNNHAAADYLSNPEVQRSLKQWLGSSERQRFKQSSRTTRRRRSI